MNATIENYDFRAFSASCGKALQTCKPFMQTGKIISLTASMVLAMIFTFSCSDDGGGNNNTTVYKQRCLQPGRGLLLSAFKNLRYFSYRDFFEFGEKNGLKSGIIDVF